METKFNRIRILLGDDHTLFRSGLIRLLNDDPELFLIGEAENGAILVEKYFMLMPDLVITDISMPVMNGTTAISEIKKRDSKVKALVLSIHSGEEYIYLTYKAGAMGLVCKSITQGELSYAIRKVYHGDYYFGSDIDSKKLREIVDRYDNDEANFKRENEATLTEREREVLRLIGEALTSNEIADRMYLSRRTIDTYRSSLLTKLKLKSLPELISYAVHYSVDQNKNEGDSD